MKKGSTLFLKLVIILIGLGVVAIAAFAVPLGIIKDQGTGQFLPLWILLYLTIIPFYIALYQGWKLLGYIDANIAFSQDAVGALNYIKYCALSMTALYLACLPWIFIAADMDDAPGAILMWVAFSSAPLVIAVFAALLQMLLENILEMKSENDLTV